MQSAGWSTVEEVIKQLTEKWNAESVVHDNEWETIRATLLREGMIRGMNNLVKEIMDQALNTND